MDRDNKEDLDEGGTQLQALPEEQIEWIREVWAKYVDQEIEGITLLDACEALHDLGIDRTEAEITSMFEEFDVNPNDPITMEQFLYVMTKSYQNLFSNESLKAAFKVFDADKSGCFKATEMRAIAMTMGVKYTDEEFGQMVREVDLDQDGKISWDEFQQGIKR